MNRKKTFAASVAGVLLLALLWWLLPRGGGDLASGGGDSASGGGTRGNASRSLRWSGGPATDSPDAEAGQGRSAASLRGRVIDATDGKPVPSAIVTLRARGGDILDETVTADDGAFAFGGIEPAVRVVAVQADGYAFLTEPLVDWIGRRASPMADGKVLELALDSAVKVSGRVVDASGNGIAGAEVSVEDREGWGRWPRPVSDTATTDGEGRFAIADAPSGTLFARATAAGRAPGEAEVGNAGPGRAREGIVITLTDGGSLRGRVLDAQGTPVAGAKVAFTPAPDEDRGGPGRGRRRMDAAAAVAPVTSGADGSFVIDSLAEGAGFLAASAEKGSGVVATRVSAGSETAVDVRLDSTGSVAGRVVDGNGAPLAGARVFVAGDWRDREAMARNAAAGQTFRSTASDAEGRFQIDGLVGETVTLAAGGDGMGQQRVEAKVGDMEVEIRLAGGDLAVTVLTADGAKPAGEVQVWVMPAAPAGEGRKRARRPLSPRVSEEGAFHFGVTPGEWEVRAQASGYPDLKPVTVTVVEGTDPAPLTFRLGRQGTVRGTLVGDDGKKVAGARVSFTEASGGDALGGEGGFLDWSEAVRSRSDGRFELAGGSGEGRLFVYHPEYEPELVPVVVPETGSLDIGLVRMRTGKGTSSVFEFSGIGAVITGDDERSSADETIFVVRSVLPGSPAERFGVRAADHVLEIDGQPTKQMGMDELIAKIRGPVGTTVTLILQRPENPTPLRIDVTREKIRS